ncbi:BatD family protein [Fulvivirga sp. 29W222]|uniref:BatD family protein n=1 Tax=Fulvivirga marina TaxID=2494733 RepID=A0A937KEJ3_9BACT|nr:BatD family protein [Fulvivirga marina]MBL6449822.1 BatD family protein [Fulvivirga marina]
MDLIYRSLRFSLLILVSVFAGQTLQAQEISISLGPDEIGENQAWTITITASNERLKSYGDFPEIEGFRMRGTSSSSSTQIINGQISSSQSVTMTYVPTSQGTFTIDPFQIKINDKMYSSPGKMVKVGAPVERQQRNDPFRSFFDHDPADSFFGRDKKTEFIDIKEDAFLALTTDKETAYVGEGITTTLSFYVADNNRAPLQFHDLGKQLSNVLKKVRPENAWEENFNIENINGEPISIRGKRYTQYKIYQGVFYPLNAEDIKFPSVGLEMIKYKVAKNPSFFGQNRKEDFKTFYSKPKTVRVKELPPHPLREQVAVGDYLLDERISSNELETGQSFSYQFNIYGEGNISAITEPMVDGEENFDFYDPNISQNINRRNNHVTGSKSFSYFGIPKEPGQYNLKDYFKWIFFNPKTQKYDTLMSSQVVEVTGESKKNESIQSNDLGSFYDRLNAENNDLKSTDSFEWIKIFTNIFILGLLGFSTVIFVGDEIKNTFKQGVSSPKELKKSLSPSSLFSNSLFLSVVIGLALTALFIGLEFLPDGILPGILSVLIYLVGIPVIIFRLTVMMHKKEGRVTASAIYVRSFIIIATMFVVTSSMSALSESYLRNAEDPIMLRGNLLAFTLLMACAHLFVFINSLPYFFYKNNIPVWKAFIPFRNTQIMGEIASYHFAWYRFFIPWPPFKLMRKIAEFQGRSTINAYANAIFPYLFFPFLLYDRKD